MRNKESNAELLYYVNLHLYGSVSNKKVFKKMSTKRTLILVRKRQLRFLGHKNRKERLENLTYTICIKGDRDTGKCHLAYSIDFCEWVTEQTLREVVGGQIFLGAASDGKL